jgi:hypothetical protein
MIKFYLITCFDSESGTTSIPPIAGYLDVEMAKEFCERSTIPGKLNYSFRLASISDEKAEIKATEI